MPESVSSFLWEIAYRFGFESGRDRASLGVTDVGTVLEHQSCHRVRKQVTRATLAMFGASSSTDVFSQRVQVLKPCDVDKNKVWIVALHSSTGRAVSR